MLAHALLTSHTFELHPGLETPPSSFNTFMNPACFAVTQNVEEKLAKAIFL